MLNTFHCNKKVNKIISQMLKKAKIEIREDGISRIGFLVDQKDDMGKKKKRKMKVPKYPNLKFNWL